MDITGKKILITGASSGIGRALAKEVISKGGYVWGIARRKNLLENLKGELLDSDNYFYSAVDVTNKDSWRKITNFLKYKKFYPDAVILGAAILRNDLNDKIDLTTTHEMFDINYFSVMRGINYLMPLIKKNSQIIAISSISSQKGSGVEGVGYAASKAALSISFESLRQKYKKKLNFKIVFLGPVKTGMSPFRKHSLLSLSKKQAVSVIMKAIKGNDVFYYRPKVVFFVLKLAKLVSQKLYFRILDVIDFLHIRNQKY